MPFVLKVPLNSNQSFICGFNSLCHHGDVIVTWNTASCGHCVFVVSWPKYLAPEVLCTSERSQLFHFDADGCVCESFQDVLDIYASSPRTDVWSVGLILLEYVLVGSPALFSC